MGLFRITMVLAVCAAACGGHHGGDDATTYTSIEVDPPLATVTVALGATATQAYTVYGVLDGTKTDITDDCILSVDAEFGTFTDATVTVGPHGGKTPVVATCMAQTGQGLLAVNLTGTIVVGPNTPPGAPGLFGGATATTDPTRTPAIQYPIDRAVSPRNIPSIEIQWAAAGNDLFHVSLTGTYLAVEIYTSSLEALLAAADWEAVAGSVAGENLSIVVEGLAQAAPATKYASATTSLTMSHDNIDKTAIYYWASSQGNIMSQVFGVPDAPSVVKNGCTSCHSVSRNGSRIGYSRCVANDCGQLFAGFMKYDAVNHTWNEVVDANNRAIRGSYTTFAPVGNPFPDDTQAVAMVSMSTGALALYDPDTGAAVPSNLDIAQHGPGAPARSALMADWSADGTQVVFASTPHAGQWIDLGDGSIATMTYQYTGGQHVFGEPQFLVPNPITLPSGTYSNFFFPSFSADGKLIVFDAARSAWRNGTDARLPGQRLMLSDAAGAWVTDLPALNGGYADSDITWAHWAPTVSNDYYWIVFSSERDYGHRSTLATGAPCAANGVRQCKQIWLGAIARNKLTGTVTLDPSAPPMWLPGQETAANNISPYWSVPAAIQ
jgi:hypothetical protein